MNLQKETAMPSKGRTNPDAKARNKSKKSKPAIPSAMLADIAETAAQMPTAPGTVKAGTTATAEMPAVPVEGGLAGRGWKKKAVNVWLPPLPRGSALGVGTAGTWLAYSLIVENSAGTSTWPAIALVGMGMAYDLGLRLIDRWR